MTLIDQIKFAKNRALYAGTGTLILSDEELGSLLALISAAHGYTEGWSVCPECDEDLKDGHQEGCTFAALHSALTQLETK